MAQRFQQPQNPVGTDRGSHQHRTHQPLAQFAREVVEHLVAGRLDVFEQLFHQLVVVICQRLQHREARRLFAIGRVALEPDHFGRGVLPVNKGTLQREIDETGNDVAGECRNLAQDQLGVRSALQEIEHVMNTGIGLVDLVEKKNPRDLSVFKLSQDEL